MQSWWSGLSEGSKAAIIAAIVGPAVAWLLGIRMRPIRWFYIRDLEKLRFARERLKKRPKKRPTAWYQSGIIDLNEGEDILLTLEEQAHEAGISLSRARRAMAWRERIKEYGS